MNDTISRQAALDEAYEIIIDGQKFEVVQVETLMGLPSAEPEIIRCKDCRWWDKCGDDIGYCMAAKHGYWSEHWEISIRRTYKKDFYCADAEMKGEKDETY